MKADTSLVCYDKDWYAYSALVIAVLVCVSLGTPLCIALYLYKKRHALYDEEGNVIPHALDILYATYHSGAYFYESITMLFKLALWASLVFPDHGSQLQLSMALIVNVLQITVHVYLKPYGREDAAIMNLMHGAGIVLTLYINFSNFL